MFKLRKTEAVSWTFLKLRILDLMVKRGEKKNMELGPSVLTMNNGLKKLRKSGTYLMNASIREKCKSSKRVAIFST
jgi:hypothetical protein